MRDCENCIRNIPGQGCTSWDCEYINRLEAIEVYEAYKNIVTCGECKWLGVDDGMPFCYWWLREIESDVFCSYGERRNDETDTKESKDM